MACALVAIGEGMVLDEREARADAFSAIVGYRFVPPEVIRGWATADSKALRLRTPGVPPD
jgi:hypothetical protein